MNTLENAIYVLQKKLRQSKIEFIFSGTFSQGLIEELGLALKQRMQLQQVKKSKISSVFFTFIEQTQNIKQYEVSKENTEEFLTIAGSGVIAISKTQSGYCINSGNIVLNADISGLKEKLNKIIALDGAELTNYFREISRREIDMNKGTCGLGLIQIARKSTEKIEYNFEKIDDVYSYYTLTVRI
ncbi:SiaB family protein kinase [Clostridium sp. JS66]|uniref:SiaB family protein kinase n=1 Tax=Clostridium sp. JS66 TaxID=3064705 RepID=UPI00298D7DB3|nr:SiaB family protein kinase [Clostridium sp. JS66]WPC44148.1 SiaB family protein kinase [Clostridium sp. JS66]